MRPKKEILLVEANELLMSVRKFFLITRGFAVSGASDSELAMKHLRAHPATQLIVIDANICSDALIETAKGIISEIKFLLLSNEIKGGNIAHRADRFLGKEQCDHFMLLEATKGMTARKRGPNKNAAADLASKRRSA